MRPVTNLAKFSSSSSNPISLIDKQLKKNLDARLCFIVSKLKGLNIRLLCS